MVEDMGDFGTALPSEPVPGEVLPPASRSKARGAAAGVGVALVVGAGGIALATSGPTSGGAAPVAATSSSANPESPSSASPGSASPGIPAPPPSGKPDGRLGGGRGVHNGFGLAIGAVGGGGPMIHGTFTVAKPSGGYETIQTQTGTVDSVSSTSIKVTSKDQYSFTYVVKASALVDAQRDGIGSVKKGDEVIVTATLTGNVATVNRLADVTQLGKNLPQGGYPGGFREGQGPTGTTGGQPALPPPPGAGT